MLTFSDEYRNKIVALKVQKNIADQNFIPQHKICFYFTFRKMFQTLLNIWQVRRQNVKLILPLPRGKIISPDDPVTKAFSDAVLKEYLKMLKQQIGY